VHADGRGGVLSSTVHNFAVEQKDIEKVLVLTIAGMSRETLSIKQETNGFSYTTSRDGNGGHGCGSFRIIAGKSNYRMYRYRIEQLCALAKEGRLEARIHAHDDCDEEMCSLSDSKKRKREEEQEKEK